MPESGPHAPAAAPPGAWQPAHRLAQRAVASVEKFLAVEAASGVVLLAVAAIALAWANSPWHESYAALLHLPIGLAIGSFEIIREFHFWVNDGLMTVFFFVVGLEIRREIHHGELSEPRRAALPVAAAIGGMLVPAAIYAAINAGQPTLHGWGVPMATDIAFALGVLALLGSRVPGTLRVTLLALAVIDDLGAILVIAIFYSSGLSLLGFVVLGVGLGTVLAMKKLGVRSPWAYVPAAALAWLGALEAGIHPTIVGVAVGLMTPARPWLGRDRFADRADASVAAVRDVDEDDERALLPHLDHLEQARREVVSPLERILHALHGWVAFGVMPLFALANAGVSLGATEVSGPSARLMVGVVAGLVLGKPLGILAASWLTTRVGLAKLPRGTSWGAFAVLGMVAGIGFTMAIFIATLAFSDAQDVEVAKLGVLLGSAVAAALAYGFGRVVLAKPAVDEEAVDGAAG